MIRKKYTIEASILTLQRFVNTLAKEGLGASFIQRVTANSTEEYYYVVVLGDAKAHDALKADRFMNSHPLPIQ